MPKPGQKKTKLFLTCHHEIPTEYELTPINYCNYKVPKFKIEVQILDEGRRMFRGGGGSLSERSGEGFPPPRKRPFQQAMQKTRKGDRRLPKISLICIAYVQTTDFGAKVHNFCVITKRRDEKCHRQFNWRTPFHHHARAQAQHRKPWQVCMGNRPEECRIPQALAAGKPHSGQGTATGGGESAEKGAMVSRADIRPSQAPGQAHIP